MIRIKDDKCQNSHERANCLYALKHASEVVDNNMSVIMALVWLVTNWKHQVVIVFPTNALISLTLSFQKNKILLIIHSVIKV